MDTHSHTVEACRLPLNLLDAVRCFTSVRDAGGIIAFILNGGNAAADLGFAYPGAAADAAGLTRPARTTGVSMPRQSVAASA
jgi:hypothetical protein